MGGRNKRFSTVVLFLLGTLLLGFTVYTSATTPLQPTLQRGIFLLIITPICLLLYPSRPRLRFLDYGLLIAGITSMGFLVVNWESLAYRAQFEPSPHEYVLGFMLVIVILELTRRVVGWPLPAIALAAILYARFGNYLPAVLSHKGYSLSRLVANQYLTHEGILSSVLGIAATLIVMFVLFGCVLQNTGLASLFLDFSAKVTGRSRGGPAQMAVIGSALFGTMSGSSTSNVLTTGTTTIPLMKKAGYKPHFAGAVEAVASCGGQIMPPVMGAAAFLMSYVTGIPYIRIIVAAALPAVLYFTAIFIEVELEARRLFLKPLSTKVQQISTRAIISRLYLLVPFGILVYLLMQMYSPTKAALWATAAALILSLPKRETRITWDKIKSLIPMFVRAVAIVGMACATAGIIIGAINLTGAGLRITYAFVFLAGDSQLLLMFLVMILSIILGMGLPTIAAYSVVASFAAPALVVTGVSKLVAHLFVFYYSCLSSVTPPVAVPAYAAASVAGSNPMRTALTSAALTLSGFLIPFMFVYRPALLLGDASVISVLLSVVISLAVVGLMSIGVTGHFLRTVSVYERLILFLAAFLLVMPTVAANTLGLALAGGVLARHLISTLRKRKSEIHE